MTEDLKRIVDYGIDGIRKDAQKFLDFQNVFTKYFSTDYNLSCDSCNGRGFTNAYQLLESTYKPKIQKTMITDDSKFAFKNNDVTIYSENRHQSFRNANLTDENALILLKENSKHHVHFARLPEDWKDQVKEFKMPKSFAQEQAELKKSAEKKAGESTSTDGDGKSDADASKKNGNGKAKKSAEKKAGE